MKTNKTYTFAVPCSYVYEIGAESEEQARKILCEKGGLDIDGELLLEDDAYRKADFIKLNRRSTKENVMKSKHLFNGYTFLNKNDESQVMLVFYTDKVVIVDTDYKEEDITINYTQFAKRFQNHQIWDFEESEVE